MAPVSGLEGGGRKSPVATAVFIGVVILGIVVSVWFPQFKLLDIVLSLITAVMLFNRIQEPRRSSHLSIIDNS